MYYNLNILLILFFLTCLMISFYYKHLLLTLINLEFMMINIMIYLYYLMIFSKLNMFFFSIILSLTICDGIMGLSILIYLIRFSGNDYTKLLNLIKW